MNPKELFEERIKNLDINTLKLHSNNLSRRAYVRSVVTDELLTWLYTVEGMSANSIAAYIKSAGIISGASHVIDRLREVGHTTRSIKETCKLPKVQDQKLKTLLYKYGVINMSQIPEVKAKKAEICMEKYGVNNNFKSTEIKGKIKEFWQTNFGVDHVSEAFPIKSTFRLSKPHKAVVQILDDLGVLHETETNKYFKAFNQVTQKRYCPVVDIYIPAKKLVIEVFGQYWHAKPSKYKPSDMFNTVYGPQEAQQIWQRDQIKVDHIKALGYGIEVVWEDEISVEHIKQMLEKYEDNKD